MVTSPARAEKSFQKKSEELWTQLLGEGNARKSVFRERRLAMLDGDDLQHLQDLGLTKESERVARLKNPETGLRYGIGCPQQGELELRYVDPMVCSRQEAELCVLHVIEKKRQVEASAERLIDTFRGRFGKRFPTLRQLELRFKTAV